jgi:hypothetical protein
VKKLKAALARRAEMQIVGFDYRQERGFDVLQAAARNEGAAGALLGAGVGAGMGLAAGAANGHTFQQLMPGAASTAAGTAGERMQLLKDLAQLRKDKVLTEAEFEAEKRRLLGT